MRTVLVAGVVSFALSSSPREAEGADPVPPRTLRTRIAAKFKPGNRKPNLLTRSVTRLRDGDPRQLDRAGLDALAARTLGSYYDQGPSGEWVDRLDHDFRLYLWNLRRLVGRRGRLIPGEAATLAEWAQVRAALARSTREGMTLSQELRGKTLEQYVLETHRRVLDPRRVDPWGTRMRHAGVSALWFPARLTGRMARGMGRWAHGAVLASLGLALFLPFINAPIQRATLPAIQYVEAKSHYYLGDLTIGVQRLVTGLDMVLDRQAKEGAGKALQEMTRIADKFAIGELEPEEARRLWSQAESGLMILGKNVNAIATGVFKEGRGNHREIQLVATWLGTYASVEYYGMRSLQGQLYEIEEKWANGTPPAAVRARKAGLQRDIAASQQRLGTLLAQWRINQIMFPEYTKLAEEGNPREAPLLLTYEQLMRGMRLDVYFDAALTEYGKVMDALGIPPAARRMDYVQEPRR